LKINPVSSKTQTKSLGFWRDPSRLCATTSSLNQRTCSLLIFWGKGRQRYRTLSFSPNFSRKFFHFSSCPFQDKICESNLSNLSFRERAFLQKRVQRYGTNPIKQIITTFFQINFRIRFITPWPRPRLKLY